MCLLLLLPSFRRLRHRPCRHPSVMTMAVAAGAACDILLLLRDDGDDWNPIDVPRGGYSRDCYFGIVLGRCYHRLGDSPRGPSRVYFETYS